MEQSIQTIIVNSQYNVFTKFDHVTYDLLIDQNYIFYSGNSCSHFAKLRTENEYWI